MDKTEGMDAFPKTNRAAPALKTRFAKKAALVICAALALTLAPPFLSESAAASARVTLPAFGVTLNGVLIDNEYRRYPVIVYKNICYVPMTWTDCRFLGLTSDWNAGGGLSVQKTGGTADYMPERTTARNNGAHAADIPTFAVTVNGAPVRNTEEQYPLLTFRDVTYFPLTWRFGVDEFGWHYEFNATEGLIIESGGARPPLNAELPLATRETDGYVYSGACAAANGHFYYEGPEHKVYSLPFGSPPTAAKAIHDIPQGAYGVPDGYAIPEITAKNGVAWLSYHLGGAQSGDDFLFKLRPDGTEAFQADTTEFGGVFVCAVRSAMMPFANNLLVKTQDADAFTAVGDPSFTHAPQGLRLIGDFIYSAASPDLGRDEGWPGRYFVCRTSLSTGKSELLHQTSEYSAYVNFYIEGDVLYYLDENGLVKKSDLAGGAVKTLRSKPVSR
ncbi:MAG: hypothetical protein LBS24_00290, partial [Clostridiales Family XIII bacterium]|nr:hypothetical protein [Clostridiales Family XIII bacterium]